MIHRNPDDLLNWCYEAFQDLDKSFDAYEADKTDENLREIGCQIADAMDSLRDFSDGSEAWPEPREKQYLNMSDLPAAAERRGIDQPPLPL